MHWGYPLHGKETNNHGRTQFFEYNRQTKKTPQAHHFKNYSQSKQDSPPQAPLFA
jgi:hypothetical protein